MKKINKYVSVLSVLTLTLFLAACGDSGNDSSAAGANASDKNGTESVTSTAADDAVNENEAADTDNTGDAAANYVTFEDLTRTQSHPKAPAVG